MGSVTLTQFVHPRGERRETSVELPDDVCGMAKGQELSCEMLPQAYSRIAFYSRKKGWDEDDGEIAFANNGSGKDAPAKVLEWLIRAVDKMTKPSESKA